MNDDELTDAWETCALGRPINHEEHVRIGRVLVLRHGSVEATSRLVEGTLRNCEALGVADRFDEDLTRRWAARIAEAVQADAARSFEDFAAAHPELRQGDLLGLPAWKTQS